MDKRHLIALTGFTVLVNLFFFRMLGSGAITIAAIGFLLYLALVLPVTGYYQKFRISAVVILISVVLPIILIQSRGSLVIQAGLTLFFLTITGYATYLVAARRGEIGSVTELLFVPFGVVFSHLSNLLSQAVTLLDSGASGRKSPVRRLTVVILGLMIGLPVAAVLLGLLTGADPVFQKTVETITSRITIGNLFWRIAGSMLTVCFAAPFIGISIPKFPRIPGTIPRDLSDALTVATALVVIVAGLFLFVQWPYVFASVPLETDLSRFGVATYSEYVRRGFGELLTAGLLMYAVSWLGYLAVRKSVPVRKSALILQLILLTELTVFIVSVLRRIILYWQFHGLTLVRIYGSIFLTAVLALTVILILRHLFRNHRWVRAEIAAVLLLIFFTGMLNAEGFIVANHPPTVNGRVDYVYLSKLSPDGYDGWRESFAFAKQTLEKYRSLNPGEFSDDDRRLISYAGAVTGTLTRNYLRLTGIYASPPERENDAELLRDSYLSHLLAYKDDAEHDLAALEKDASAAGRLDRLTGAGDPDWKKRTLTSQLAVAETQLGFLTGYNRASVLPVSFYRFLPSSTFIHPDFMNNTCSYTMHPDAGPWCLPGFYTFRDTPGSEPTLSDRIFRWNIKTAGVYRQFRTDMPLASLLAMQNDFISIHRLVTGMPDSLRNVSWDISTETVFLETF